MNKCPNCGLKFIHRHRPNGCVLAALIEVLRDRETLEPEEILERLLDCNVDHMWNEIGSVIDALEDGEYLRESETHEHQDSDQSTPA